jgi:hypothetical protein
VFALYDLLFNVPFVLGAAGAALIMPRSGLSYPLIAIVTAGYVVAAAAYSLLQRQSAGGPPGSGPSSPAGPAGASPSADPPSTASPSTGTPSVAAQRNSA